jgi:hypothetical protein
MTRRNRVLPGSRWLLPILAVLLVLGHACELPAYSDRFAPVQAASGAGHDDDEHSHRAEIACDPVDVLPSAGGPHPDRQLVDSPVVLVTLEPPVPVRAAAMSLEDSKSWPSRPPLFLLHASLLI